MRIALFILSLAVSTAWSQSCPYKENIKPCSCSIGSDKTLSVTCEGVSSINILNTAVRGLKNYKLSTFTLDKSNIGVLPGNIFSDMEIHNLKILFTNITSISETLYHPPFMGQEKILQSLYMKDAFLDNNFPLTRLTLSHLKKITSLQLDGNYIPIIGNDWFEVGPYGLKELLLLQTGTVKLGTHAFFALSELKKLSLTGGSITEITRNMLPRSASFLQSLDLSNNKIISLPDDIFTNMPSLQEINLEANDLTSISELTYSQIWSQLSSASFTGNPLNCDQEMKWIYKYRLPATLHGSCASPDAMRFRTLTSLTLADFA